MKKTTPQQQHEEAKHEEVKAVNTEKNEKFSHQKQWDYRHTTKRIASSLSEALILFKMKTGNNGKPEIEQLAYNDDWKIIFDKGNDGPKQGPVDVLGAIENINILNIRKDLFAAIENDTTESGKRIDAEDQKRLKEGIDSFIETHFKAHREKLEKKQTIPHGKFRSYYTKLAAKKENLTDKEKKLYRDVCLTLANMLYDKNHSYLDKDGKINQQGLAYICRVFFKTIKNIPHSGSSKPYEKIFHDGDFNFLYKETPIVGTLDHYVQIIMYLMDSHGFNAYADGGEEGANEWYKTRKSFLNSLYVTARLDEEHTKERISDKGILHEQLAEKWNESQEVLEDNPNRSLSSRLKSDTSKMLKKGGRTDDIKDESGIRATYYGEDKEHDDIKGAVLSLCKEYFKKISKIEGITINSIQSDRKGDLISKDDEDSILEELGNYLNELGIENFSILRRIKSGTKKSLLESISSKYKEFTNKNPSPGLQQAYKIASGEVKRGSNGDYEDFKLIVSYSINKDDYNDGIDADMDSIDDDTDLSQEISFYSNKNDLNMGNHNFLDLEKKIFNRVKGMNIPGLGKSISLGRLRKFTEIAIKETSFDIDIYEDKIARGLLPNPQNDDYKYLCIEGKRIPLKGLVERNENNSEQFDELIPYILNYFIKKNKIFYLNKEDQTYYGLIKPEWLHKKSVYKERRFTTSDVLRNSALNSKNENESICFYTENAKSWIYPHFYSVTLGDLGDFIGLEKHVK